MKAFFAPFNVDNLYDFLALNTTQKNIQNLPSDNLRQLAKEKKKKEGILDQSMMKMIELDVSILVSGERKTDAELAMEKWIYNVLESSENKEDRKQFFDTSKYKSYLVSNNEKVKYIFENFRNFSSVFFKYSECSFSQVL